MDSTLGMPQGRAERNRGPGRADDGMIGPLRERCVQDAPLWELGMVLRFPSFPKATARLAAVRRRLVTSSRAHPRTVVAVLVAGAIVFWTSTAALAWFTYDVTHNLPGRAAVAAIGEMAQATVLYDSADRPVFTIFKEQRIEVPLSRVSPNISRRPSCRWKTSGSSSTTAWM